MRVTAGLLLTVALLIPGTVRAQTGIPGYYDPFGSRPGFPGAPGVSVGPRTPYFPGLPSQVNDMLRNQDVRGTPFGPGGFRQPGPGLPYMPDGVGESYVPDVPSIGDPFGRRFRGQFPAGMADPYNPTARFRDPGWWNSIHDQTIPDIRNLPQVPPSVTLPPSAALPPHFVEDNIHEQELEVKQKINGIATFAPIGLAILAMFIGTLCRRRGGKDDAVR